MPKEIENIKILDPACRSNSFWWEHAAICSIIINGGMQSIKVITITKMMENFNYREILIEGARANNLKISLSAYPNEKSQL